MTIVVLLINTALMVFFGYRLDRQNKRLTALRRNAFITNARGHRVRYVNATPDEQARAEQV